MKCFISQKKNMKEITIFFFFLIGFSSCSPFHSHLDQLGSSDYNDVKIPIDFGPDDFNDNNIQNIITSEEPQQIVEQSQQNSKNNVSFAVEDEVFALAHGQALRWKGCYRDQRVMGGYGVDKGCGNAFLQKDFHNNLNLTFLRCIQDSAQVAGYPKPVKIFIHHLGTYNNRRTRDGTRLSLHAQASAMDIVKFELFDNSGNSQTVSTFRRHYRGSQAAFYDEFRDCWKESLPEKCTAEKIEYKGSIGHETSKLGGSSLNNDHLHLSLPYCAMTHRGLRVVSREFNNLQSRSTRSGNSHGGQTQAFRTTSSRSHIFNCNNTIYRTRHYSRHSCLSSMSLKEKTQLIMNDVSTINRLRPEFNLDPRLSACVAYRESRIAPNAKGRGSDYGIFQVTNSTARYVLRMHNPVTPSFAQYRGNQNQYRRAMLGSTLAQADLYHSVMLAKAKQENLLNQINNNPESVSLLRRLATSYNGRGQRARSYGRDVSRCYQAMKQVASRTHIHRPSGVGEALAWGSP